MEEVCSPLCADIVEERLAETIGVLTQVGSQALTIHTAADALVAVYRGGGKLLLCGNGGSAADAQHIAGEMTGRFLRDRAPWPAVALHCNTSTVTAIANDFGPDLMFSRQVEGLGSPGDMLWALSTSGESRNCIEAMAFVGGGGGEMKRLADICIHVPHSSTPHVQEAHIALAHIICELVELALTGSG
jgi:D-sedoheptulose 7-phosphate isomerase